MLLRRSQIPQFMDTFGWVAYRRGDYAVAVSSLEGAVADLPNVAAIRLHLGMSHLAIGQDTKAMEQFAKARELAPNDNELKINIETALTARPKKSKAG